MARRKPTGLDVNDGNYNPDPDAPKKELRLLLDPTQHQVLRVAAAIGGLTMTAFARQVLVERAGKLAEGLQELTPPKPGKEE
jgi:hypothetical protein